MTRSKNSRLHPRTEQQIAGRLAGALLTGVALAVVALCGLGFGEHEPAWLPTPAAAATTQEAPTPIGADSPRASQREFRGEFVAAGADAGRGLVHGRVVDVHGTGIEGVAIGTQGEAAAVPTTTSGDDGAFACALPPGIGRLIAVDPRWETVQAALPCTEGRVTIVVAERIELRGSVLDTAGAPVAGAMLAVVPQGPSVHDGVPRQWLTFSADDGTFTFAAVPALPTASLWTQHPGMLADERAMPIGAPRGILVQLRREAAAEPVVGAVFGPDGAPLAGATARLGAAVANTTSDGAFRLAPTSASPVGTPLFVYAAGCTPVQMVDPRPEHGGIPPPLTVLLRPAVAISGRIVDPAGLPLRDWIVTLADPTPLGADAPAASVEGQLGGVRTVTDADGRFCLPSVFERDYTIEAWAFQGGGVLRALVAPGSGTVTLVAAPQPVGTRRGVVLDEGGRPVAGVVVGEARPGCEPVQRNSMRFDERAITDSAGRFQLAHAGAALHLLVDGESIMPTRLPLAPTTASTEPLTVRVQRRRVVHLPADVPAAVTITSVGADGREQPAGEESAHQLGVAASATALVVRRHGVSLGRLPLVGGADRLDLCVQAAAPAR